MAPKIHNGFDEMLEAVRSEMRPGDEVVCVDDRSLLLIGFTVVGPRRTGHYMRLSGLRIRAGVTEELGVLPYSREGRDRIARSLSHGHPFLSSCPLCAVDEVMGG